MQAPDYTKNYYFILGVKPSATQEELKQSYHALAKKYHPDTNIEAQARAAEEIFKDINEAYHLLSNPLTRASYDYSRELGVTAPAAPVVFGTELPPFDAVVTDKKARSHARFERMMRESLVDGSDVPPALADMYERNRLIMTAFAVAVFYSLTMLVVCSFWQSWRARFAIMGKLTLWLLLLYVCLELVAFCRRKYPGVFDNVMLLYLALFLLYTIIYIICH